MTLNPVIHRFGIPLGLASAGLLAFLGLWEGGDRTVYADDLAGGLPTACYGITKHTSPHPVVVGDVWSEQRCRDVAGLVVTGNQLDLINCIDVPIGQNVFDALSSHAHNFGVANTCASRAVGLINGGAIAAGCDALAHGPDGRPVWSYVRNDAGEKTFVRGLYNRRLAERELCLTAAPGS